MDRSGVLKGLPMELASVGVAPMTGGSAATLDVHPPVETDVSAPLSRQQAADVVGLHFDFIWRLLRRLGVPEHEVDDAAQQVFLTATRKGLRSAASDARPFLYGIAIRVASNHRRTVRRRHELPEDAMGEPLASDPAADDLADLRRARALLDEILERMPLELRVVFILSEIKQMTAASIAELERIPAGTVASRL